jgi:hypothetical protein
LKSWISCLTVTVLGVTLMLPAMAKDPKDQGFSGKWVMDRSASHGSEMLGDLRQDIKVSGSEVTVASRFPEPATGIAPLLYLGVMATSIRLTTDGQPVTNHIGPFDQISKTTIEGNKMTTEWTANKNGDPVEGKWVRTLSDDGKKMTMELTESSTHGQKGDATITFKRK